eukprot:125145_1
MGSEKADSVCEKNRSRRRSKKRSKRHSVSARLEQSPSSSSSILNVVFPKAPKILDKVSDSPAKETVDHDSSDKFLHDSVKMKKSSKSSSKSKCSHRRGKSGSKKKSGHSRKSIDSRRTSQLLQLARDTDKSRAESHRSKAQAHSSHRSKSPKYDRSRHHKSPDMKSNREKSLDDSTRRHESPDNKSKSSGNSSRTKKSHDSSHRRKSPLHSPLRSKSPERVSHRQKSPLNRSKSSDRISHRQKSSRHSSHGSKSRRRSASHSRSKHSQSGQSKSHKRKKSTGSERHKCSKSKSTRSQREAERSMRVSVSLEPGEFRTHQPDACQSTNPIESYDRFKPHEEGHQSDWESDSESSATDARSSRHRKHSRKGRTRSPIRRYKPPRQQDGRDRGRNQVRRTSGVHSLGMSDRYCINYTTRGNCRYGSTCKYIHDGACKPRTDLLSRGTDNRICHQFENYGTCDRSSCRFTHHIKLRAGRNINKRGFSKIDKRYRNFVRSIRTICRDFAFYANCIRGKSCHYSHRRADVCLARKGAGDFLCEHMSQ